MLESGDALALVDVQNDFLPGGKLPVLEGDAVVPILNRYVEQFTSRGLPVFASRDWHTPGHCSFREQGGPWPIHCIAGTWGAEFARELYLPTAVQIISKAMQPDREVYSDFDGTNLRQQLEDQGVRRLFIGGLATEYCIRATVRDARILGYAVVLLVDAIRAIDVYPGDGRSAEEEMIRLGAVPVRFEQIVA